MGILDRIGTGEFTIPDRLDPARTDLRAEFMADPLGYHSPELQLALGAMRSSRELPRWVLVTVQPGRSWRLAEAGRRGEPLRILPEPLFTDRAEAERYVFDLRWQALTTDQPARRGRADAAALPLVPGPGPMVKQITGYCDPLSAAPGDEVRFFVSCAPGIGEFRADLVRLRAGAPGWEDEGPECTPAPSDFEGSYPARHQAVHAGSWAEIPGGGAALGDRQHTVAVLVQPTCPAAGGQVILSCGDPWAGTGFALTLDGQLRPALVQAADPAHPLAGPDALEIGTWSLLLVTLGGAAPAALAAGPLAGEPAGWPVTAAPAAGPAEPAGTGDLVLGAVRAPSGQTRMHFTGRMEAPLIVPGAAGPAEGLRLARAGPAAAAAGSAVAAWDFSLGMDGWDITDRGPRGLHGTLHNLPMRAVRGAFWSGRTDDWREAPGEYAALHFLADALEDCRWASDFGWRIPPGTGSGFYAARITGGGHQDYIPFFVRPAVPGTAKVLLIAPSATYTSYGNSRFWWENPVQEMVQDRLVEIGAEEQYLIAHPELGASSYDCHLDGTDVCYVSRRRPNLNMRPGHVRREGYTSDLYLVAFLDRLGIDYDVVTDEDVHAAGADLLGAYPVILTGTHPEYMTARMFDAISDWTGAGGRLMYLGGNGFSMNVTFGAERPWIMENRRAELWERDEETQRSEARNATDGVRGGYLAASGRQPAGVTGVESATMGFDHSYPYVLSAQAGRPEAAFIFAGVPAAEGGVLGDYGALGGGVVGQEWDNAAGHELGPGHLILTSSRDHTLVPPMFGAVRPDYHADLVYYRRGAGAAFSVSSMAWCGALSHRDYDNQVARITRNVLSRFLDPAPLATPGKAPEQ
ncbi:MAG TPA: N,N-dimethylformamidase beta subunit family domain-containing protein [Streptosporangiaceae bacterium]|nr:N,N-dimethylformamidase beta subunit family domain-containing protein [Streptosporangiaceae bacterium]